MNLARRFKAGSAHSFDLVASATVDNRAFQASLTRREPLPILYPALKRRAKFTPTLRVEELGNGYYLDFSPSRYRSRF
jgi:hypothetical protein